MTGKVSSSATPSPTRTWCVLSKTPAALGRPVCVSTRDRLAANGTDTDLTDYFFIANEPVPVADDFDAVCAEDIYQLMLGCRPKDYPALLDGAPGAKIAAWWDRAVDVIPAGGGKGIGIEKMLAYYGLDKAEALAFGRRQQRPGNAAGCGHRCGYGEWLARVESHRR